MSDTPKQYTLRDMCAATELLVDALDGNLCNDLGPHLTCCEAETFAEFLTVHGSADAARQLIESHALGDDDFDDEDHVKLRNKLLAEMPEAKS